MRYALIGCGRIAQRHLAAAPACGLEVTALCDALPEKALRLAKEAKLPCEGGGVSFYGDYRRMLDRERPQLVCIATDSGSHAQIAIESLERGIPLIVEKPLALSSAHAAEICRLSREKSLPVAVCHQNRFNPSVMALKGALDSGLLGPLYYGAAAVRWKRDANYYAQAQWRGRWQSDGGVLMNQCIHAADMLIHLFGRPVSVSGLIERKARPIEAEDFGAALVTFEGGRSAILEGSSLMEPQNLEETVFVSGGKGGARLEGVAMNKLCFLPSGLATSQKVEESVADVYGTGHQRLYKDMIRALGNGSDPAVTCEDGRLAMELVLAIYRSARLGGAPVGFMESEFSTAQMQGFFDSGGESLIRLPAGQHRRHGKEEDADGDARHTGGPCVS